MEKQKNRIEWIDVAKGIAIVAMVLGHTGIPEIGRKFIWAFHMPIFFIISGLLYNGDKNKKVAPFLFKRIQTLVVPFLFFSCVTVLGSRLTENPINITSLLLNGWGGFALWFVQVLFVTELLYCLITPPSGLLTNKLLWSIIVLCFYLCGFFLYKRSIRFPWSMDVVLWAITFYSIGNTFKEWFLSIHFNVPVTLIFLACLILSSWLLPRTDMCSNNQGIFLLNTCQAVFGAITIFSIAKIICRYNIASALRVFLDWAGKNTFLIMGLSQLIIMILNDNLFTGLPWYYTILKHLVLWGLLWLISLLMNNYLPFFVGKRANTAI